MINLSNKDLIFKTLKNKIINGSRQLLVYNLAGLFKLNLIVEYPKSGGTWLGQLISSYFDIPFPRNRMPVLRRSVVHGHFLPMDRIKNAEKIFFMVRDGRDIMVSMYYHFLVWNEKNKLQPKDILYYRKKLEFKDYTDIRKNLPEFMEFVFTDKPSKLTRFRHEGNWVEFNNGWLDFIDDHSENTIITRYESLLEDTEKELARILTVYGIKDPDKNRIKIVVKKFSFENQAKRKQGIENSKSFLRKGISGDWKDKFSKEAGEVFSHYANDMLIRLGYEKNSGWVNDID